MVFTKKTSNVFFKLSVWKDRMDETFKALIMNVFLIKRVILLTVNMMDTLHAPKRYFFCRWRSKLHDAPYVYMPAVL